MFGLGQNKLSLFFFYCTSASSLAQLHCLPYDCFPENLVFLKIHIFKVRFPVSSLAALSGLCFCKQIADQKMFPYENKEHAVSDHLYKAWFK